MKKILLITSITMLAEVSFAQIHTVEATGNVGVGTKTPSEKLSVEGNIGVTGDLKMSGSDSYIWTNGTGTGYTGIWDAKNGRSLFYTSENTGNVGIGTTAPSEKLSVEGNVGITGDLKMSGSDSYIWTNGTGTGYTGIWDAKNSRSLFYTSENTGNVGIGTTSPAAKLDVNGNIRSAGSISINALTDGSKASRFSVYGWASSYFDLWKDNNQSINLTLKRTDGTTVFDVGGHTMTAFFGGKVGIGTTAPDEKLTVNGKIHATEIKVDLNVPAPDYVFERDYELPKLKDIESYIAKHKHLPEVPSAKEMEKNGINISDMNMLLLKKVEELTLHLIEKDKQVTDLIIVTEKQESRIKQLEARIKK